MLHQRDGTYYLHAAVEKDIDLAEFSDESTENGVVLCVDLNVEGYPAIAITGAFFDNADYLDHKREEYGIGVENVAPQYTNQRCSHRECRFTHEDNHEGDEFECLRAGRDCMPTTTPPEYRWRLVQHWLTSGVGRARSQLALKSGTLNTNRDYRSTQLG